MTLTEQEQVIYLANVILAAHADSAMSPREMAALEEIRLSISAKKATLNAALKAVESGSYSAVKSGSFATQVSNVADMLYMCFVDGELESKEKVILSDFCRKISLTAS